MARPSKLDPDRAERLLNAVRTGNYFETACAIAGIAPSTGYGWVHRGQAEAERRRSGLTAADRRDAGLPSAASEQRFVEFAEALATARGELEQRIVAAVMRSSIGGVTTKKVKRTLKDGTVEEEETVTAPDGRVALEFLARAFPGNWARRQALEVEVTTGEGGGASLQASGAELLLARRFAEWRQEREADVEDAELVGDDEREQPALEAG